MSKIILFLLGFAVGTLVHRGWQHLSKARRRDINGKIERGRRTAARMERRQRPEKSLGQAMRDSGMSWSEFTEAMENIARRTHE